MLVDILYMFQIYSIIVYLYQFTFYTLFWRDEFIDNISRYLDDVFNQMGITLINQKSCTASLKGAFFGSFGPEILIEFMRMSSVVYGCNKVKLEKFNLWGFEFPIKMMGTYEEWITYLAEYK